MTHTNPTSSRRGGVTLVEMMVALAITTFVILVVNQLFNQVITTVRRGTQAGEILQRSRAFDEQIATETELRLPSTFDPTLTPPASNYAQWQGRMLGPAGRKGNGPGGFLVIVQRVINAPLTLDDQVKGIKRDIRSDQLMFIYDQTPDFDQSGRKRLPPLTPSNNATFGGDMVNSINADYVRIWYGHVVQIRDGETAVNYPPANLNQIDLGVSNGTNPNAIAQDWVLGRQALFLTGADVPNNLPRGNYALGNILPTANVLNGGRFWNGMTDVSNRTLNDLINSPSNPQMGLSGSLSALAYQGRALSMMFTQRPLLTSAKPITTSLSSQDIAPTSTYFMGGVSDFIVEWAGDVVTGVSYFPTAAQVNAGPDGELDRDPEGRIKWYTWMQPNPDPGNNRNPVNPNRPVTYAAPDPTRYTPNVPTGAVNAFFAGRVPDAGHAAFVWQNEGTPGFTQWPWLIRIRYRLHDRRGEFEGRQVVVNTATGETRPEPGAWFETIIPVNYQGVK